MDMKFRGIYALSMFSKVPVIQNFRTEVFSEILKATRRMHRFFFYSDKLI